MNNSCLVHNILPVDNHPIKTEVYIVVMHASRIPPHILLCVHGKLFSLSVKGSLVDEDISVYLRTIKKHRIETLFIQLAPPPVFTMEQLQEIVTGITLSYDNLKPGLITCLTPVKDFCRSVYQTDTGNVKFIFELLPKLRQQGVTGNTYHLNMESRLKSTGNIFALKTYSMFEVNEHIHLSGLLSA